MMLTIKMELVIKMTLVSFYFYHPPKFTSTSLAEDIVRAFPIFRKYSEELRLKISLILLQLSLEFIRENTQS